MTSAQFIDKWFSVNDGKERRCSNIIKDREGNIYSYGWHYPLLFKICGQTFRNVTGYSPSTSKHIAWASGHDAIDVHIQRGARLYHITLSDIAEWQADEVFEQRALMNSKKRKDTAVYGHMLHKMGRLLDARDQVLGML